MRKQNDFFAILHLYMARSFQKKNDNHGAWRHVLEAARNMGYKTLTPMEDVNNIVRICEMPWCAVRGDSSEITEALIDSTIEWLVIQLERGDKWYEP
jgi:hypothetical protein